MRVIRKVWILILIPFLVENSSAFIFRWPWNFFYPGAGTTATVGAASINYGFLRPAIIVPVTTTTAPTTTTTTTSPNQLFINALLGSSLPVTNSSLLISIANALSNRPVVGGLARPYPAVVAGGGIATGGVVGGFPATGQFPSVVGGVASPIGGVASPIGGVGGGGFVLPPGFPAGGGVAASGILPGFYPGILGRSNKDVPKDSSKPSSGRVVFASKK